MPGLRLNCPRCGSDAIDTHPMDPSSNGSCGSVWATDNGERLEQTIECAKRARARNQEKREMEKTINDGGPAFPETRWSESHRQEIQWMGMSLRDYFAAKAMQTLLTKPLMITGPGLTINFAALSKDAYLMADAMIAERCNEVPRG